MSVNYLDMGDCMAMAYSPKFIQAAGITDVGFLIVGSLEVYAKEKSHLQSTRKRKPFEMPDKKKRSRMDSRSTVTKGVNTPL